MSGFVAYDGWWKASRFGDAGDVESETLADLIDGIDWYEKTVGS